MNNENQSNITEDGQGIENLDNNNLDGMEQYHPITLENIIENNNYSFITSLTPIINRILDNQLLNNVMEESLNEYNLKYNNNIKISAKKTKTKKDCECSICLEKIKKGTEIYTLPCGHYFHQKCLDEWVKYKSECPICRNKINSTSPPDNSTSIPIPISSINATSPPDNSTSINTPSQSIHSNSVSILFELLEQ